MELGRGKFEREKEEKELRSKGRGTKREEAGKRKEKGKKMIGFLRREFLEGTGKEGDTKRRFFLENKKGNL